MNDTILLKDLLKEKESKKIELIKFLDLQGNMVKEESSGVKLKKMILLCKNYTSDGLDLMLSCNDFLEKDEAILFLGYWNDGVL